MRVLLDECVPRALRKAFSVHEVKTTVESGWAGIKNGALLKLAEKEFDLFLTVDRNLEYQQNFTGVSIAVVVMHAQSNDIDLLRPLIPAVLAAMSKAKPGVVTHVHG